MKKIFIFTAICYFILSCDDSFSLSEKLSEIEIISPKNNATVSNIVIVECQTDNRNKLEYLDLFIDDNIFISRILKTPYVFEFGTGQFEEKSRHSIFVRGRDFEGNIMESKSLNLTFNVTDNYPDTINIISIKYFNSCFEIKWESSTDSSFSSYRVEKSFDKDFYNYESIFVAEQVNDTIAFDCNVDQYAYQYFRICVTDTSGNESISPIKKGNPFRKGLQINEIYTAGPENNFFYFYDQFIELYNSSDDTLYLDGIIVCRMGPSIDSVVTIFQFPGDPIVGQEYPIHPEDFIVCAMDAVNHRQIVFRDKVSVDLSNADWEFRNSLDYGDYNNPDVPDIENIEVGYTLDFMLPLVSSAVLIADGSDINYLDGIDIETVIDCVEYSSDSIHVKEMPPELDAGYTGQELTKYSGHSLERKLPGMDTNNSGIDFEMIIEPTVGYSHSPQDTIPNCIYP